MSIYNSGPRPIVLVPQWRRSRPVLWVRSQGTRVSQGPFASSRCDACHLAAGRVTKSEKKNFPEKIPDFAINFLTSSEWDVSSYPPKKPPSIEHSPLHSLLSDFELVD
ncbi:hypothetical protein EVAR_94727_1 [Eumeta japonica]|uniref:Uncharacterized protein n=1 Tax=Eumeta variegata TaxID=151549 RepID=A0A4C1UX07_EUMVA|nr:hypothetical protein EVAR_94727_1 [Eumeta japonica]